MICIHPTDQVVYHWQEDEDGYEEESYWCRDCNVWLTIPEVTQIRNRPDWVTWQTEG